MKIYVTSFENKDIRKNMSFQINTTTRLFKALVFTVWLQMAFLCAVKNYFDPFSTTPSKYKHIKQFSVVLSSLVFYVYSSYPMKHIHTVFVCLALL